MDFDFPAPYDHELPRRIGEARRQLSPEGVAVLERVIADESGDLENIIAAIESLPAPDRHVLVGISRFFAGAYDARIRESQGWAGLQRRWQGSLFGRGSLTRLWEMAQPWARLSWYSSAMVSRLVSLMRSLRWSPRCRKNSQHRSGPGSFGASALLVPLP